MRAFTNGLATILVAILATNAAFAQSGSRNVGGGGGGIGGGGGVGGGGGTSADGFSGSSSSDFASTPAEGAARGTAAVIQSIGRTQLDASEAAVNYQEATKRLIENRVSAANAANDILRARLDRQELANALREERSRRFRELRDGVRGNSVRSDVTRLADGAGNISWPRALETNLLYTHRTRLERLFAERSSTTEVASVESALQGELNALRRTWKGQIRRMNPRTYLSGKRFIDELERELSLPPAELPAPVEVLASVSSN